MNQELTAYIRRYIDISDAESEVFQSHLMPLRIKKKEYLLREGQLCKSRYYITKGVVRMYYIDNKANEQIVHFGIDNWWITDYESLINKTPSAMSIQAVEHTEILELTQDKFDLLSQQLPIVDKLFRCVMEKTYIAFQKRMEYMFSLSGEELYKTFVEANPEFTQRVPQYMIASYLGMTPEFVSKLRKKFIS